MYYLNMNFESIGKDIPVSDDKFLYMSNLDFSIKNSIISTNNKFSLFLIHLNGTDIQILSTNFVK